MGKLREETLWYVGTDVSNAVTMSLAPLQILFEYYLYNHTTVYVLYKVIHIYSVFTDVPYICTQTHNTVHV